MWQIILNALIKEVENNPGRIISLVESIVGLLKEHPPLVSALASRLSIKSD